MDLLNKLDFPLPEPRVLKEVGKINDTNYFPYHYRLGHTIEDCLKFKNWFEDYSQPGAIVFPKYNHIKQSSSLIGMVSKKKDDLSMDSEGWRIFLSKNSKRIFSKAFHFSLVKQTYTYRTTNDG